MAENTKNQITSPALEVSEIVTSPPMEMVEIEDEPLEVDVDLSVTVGDKLPAINLISNNNIVSSKPPEEDDSAGTNKLLELYKLEYSTGVKRHDDIYKSLWTNFSYMAILAGGILTFGKESFPTEIIIAIACLPLIFWFWASFLPLDRYGNKVAERMAEVENNLNIVTFGSPRGINERQGIHLYSDFEHRKNSSTTVVFPPVVASDENSKPNFFREKVRVIHSITVFALLIHLLFIGLIFYGINKYRKNEYNQKPAKETTEQKLESINKTLGEMSNSMKK